MRKEGKRKDKGSSDKDPGPSGGQTPGGKKRMLCNSASELASRYKTPQAEVLKEKQNPDLISDF